MRKGVGSSRIVLTFSDEAVGAVAYPPSGGGGGGICTCVAYAWKRAMRRSRGLLLEAPARVGVMRSGLRCRTRFRHFSLFFFLRKMGASPCASISTVCGRLRLCHLRYSALTNAVLEVVFFIIIIIIYFLLTT